FIIVSGDSRQKFIEAAIEGTKQAEIAQERKEKLLQKINGNLNNVPLFIIVVMKKSENKNTYEEDYAATSCVIQNFSLLAWEKGIGNIWKTNAFLHFQAFHDFLGVGVDEQIIGNLHVGYPEKVPNARPRKEIDEIITVLD
ncbi:MAG: nitroreductase family protein, partial [Bacillaceae bacterium]